MAGEKSSVRQFLIKVDGIDGYWGTFEGGNIASSTTKTYDGGETTASIITSQAEVDDITVTRNYDRIRDKPYIDDLRKLVGAWTTTISVTPTDGNLAADGDPDVYPNVTLSGVQVPQPDAEGTDPAKWGLMFAVPGVA